MGNNNSNMRGITGLLREIKHGEWFAAGRFAGAGLIFFGLHVNLNELSGW
jgi:hypothetical protein